MISHRSDDCTGVWQLKGRAEVGKGRINCTHCGVGFDFTMDRYKEMMRENTFGYLASLETDAGRRLLEKQKRRP